MKTLTYGTLPTREEFDAAFNARAYEWGARFVFTNDPRVGTCELTCSELWAELARAQREYVHEGPCEPDCDEGSHDAAGQWCSDVLGILGFEWV